MIFSSDNWAGVHPRIAENLHRHSTGMAQAYGTSPLDRTVGETFNRIFEREVEVFFVGTGTAANALSMAAVSRPGGFAYCHREAHLVEDECGAPDFFSGARLQPVDGPLGKIDPDRLARAIGRFTPPDVHGGQPMAISITQSTESGTVYALPEIDTIAAIAREHGLPLHMDGARFANALVALDTTAAEMTWKRGVDLLSFGATKNGCWCAEAVVIFDPALARQFPYLRKRSAQLFSKSRFIAAQFEAYFADDLWLETARHTNAMATVLAGHIRRSGGARLAWEPQANEVFAILPNEMSQRLKTAGALFYDWRAPHGFTGATTADEGLFRFVTSFATDLEAIEAFGRLLR